MSNFRQGGNREARRRVNVCEQSRSELFLFSTEPKHKKYFVQMYYVYRIVERGVGGNKSVTRSIIKIADVCRDTTSVKSRHDNDPL